jgi:hypothetical protein
MDITVAKMQPTIKNYPILKTIMNSTLKEILHEILESDWHLFKDLSGMEIIQDSRLRKMINLRKYSIYSFKYAITPLKKQDFLEEHVQVYIALEKTTKEIIGFSIWARNLQLEEYNILVFVYVFQKHRRNYVAKKLLEGAKTKVILVDEPNLETRKLLSKYFKEKTILGLKDEYE